MCLRAEHLGAVQAGAGQRCPLEISPRTSETIKCQVSSNGSVALSTPLSYRGPRNTAVSSQSITRETCAVRYHEDSLAIKNQCRVPFEVCIGSNHNIYS